MDRLSFRKIAGNAFRWLGLCLLLLLMGCSGEEVAEQAKCRSHSDCVLPEQCNVILGACEHVRTEPTRPANPGEAPQESSDTGVPSGSSDVEGNFDVSDGLGGAGQDASVPEDTGSVGQDTSVGVDIEPDVPELTMCEAISQRCDLSRPVQGDFVCVEGGGQGSICLRACDQANHPSTCEPGFYCREHTVGATSVLGCAMGGCVTNRDCDHISILGGNCIDQGNGYKECVEGGLLLEGEACQGGANDQCMEGTRCRVTNAGAGTGVCARLCNPWSPIFTCPGIEFCEPTVSGQGICTDHVSDPGYYNEPYEKCSRPGAMCNDGAKCRLAPDFWGSDYYCVPYCRTGMNDCSGIYGPGLFGGATYCDLTVFSNTNQIGYCLE